MADNLDITPGTGRTIATDQVAGVDYQRVKAVWGADGTVNDVDVASGMALPVQVRSATGLIPIGEPTDDKSIATDTTSVSAISIWKQISASIQAAAASLAGALTVAAHDVTNAGTFAVQSAHETSKISNAGTALTPKFAKISVSSSGANTIVSAVTGKKIRVLAWDCVANAAVNFKWQSHITPTDLTGLYYMAGQGNGVARSFNPVGYFETVAGEALDLNLSGAVAVGGVLTYVEV